MVDWPRLSRIPRHLGVIPDGNRRWAQAQGLGKHEGFAAGVAPGLQLLEVCRGLGIEEVSVYGFMRGSARRPTEQVKAFASACVDLAERITALGAALKVVGDMTSSAFPEELKRFSVRSSGDIRVNLLANYSWQWDLRAAPQARERPFGAAQRATGDHFASSDISRVDLIVRWGGKQRLSGFLPIQSAHADLYVIDTLWPAMSLEELFDALEWYERQEIPLAAS
jgi:undecaprenyl diphosphate synthase